MWRYHFSKPFCSSFLTQISVEPKWPSCKGKMSFEKTQQGLPLFLCIQNKNKTKILLRKLRHKNTLLSPSPSINIVSVMRLLRALEHLTAKRWSHTVPLTRYKVTYFKLWFFRCPQCVFCNLISYIIKGWAHSSSLGVLPKYVTFLTNINITKRRLAVCFGRG